MTLVSKIEKAVVVLVGVAVVFMVGIGFYADQRQGSNIDDLYAGLQRSDEEKKRDLVSWTGQGVIGPIAAQVNDRRLDLINQVQTIVKVSNFDRLLIKSLNPNARQAGLAGRVRGLKDWQSVKLLDNLGRVQAAFADGKEDPASIGRDLGKTENFLLLSKDKGAAGQAFFSGYRAREAGDKAEGQSGNKGKRPLKPNSDKNKKTNTVERKGEMVVVMAMVDAKGGFDGMVEVGIKVESLFGLNSTATLSPVKAASKNSVLMLLQGTGNEFYNTKAGKAFTEDFPKVSSVYKDVLARITRDDSGAAPLKYDGEDGMLVWRRLGYWDDSQGAASLQVLATFMPYSDFKAGARALDEPSPVFADLLFWVLILVLAGALTGFALVLIKTTLAPLKETADAASLVQEEGSTSDLLEFPEQKFKDLKSITQALNLLLQRAATSEGRVKELDESLRRQENQSSDEATSHAAELSKVRQGLSAAETEAGALKSQVLQLQSVAAESEKKLGNLKAGLDTAEKSLELKNSQNKSLNSQVQELMGSLEEQRKVAEDATENTVNRTNEIVRLDAIKTLSSELKATLGVIKNYISTMLGSVGKISDAQQEFLGVVINKSARLERLINDLVELSQIASGIVAPKLETVDLASLIREVILNVQVQADHKKITLDYAEGSGSLNIRIDKDKFSQVLRILLTQAIKVTARNEKISVLASEREGNIEVRISDPGMSLPPDRAERVFNQFHGVDSPSGPEFIGTGLRFPIVKSVLQAHGGSVRIESQVGRGKTFMLSLPKDAKAEQIKAPLTPSPTGFPGSTPAAPMAPVKMPVPAAPVQAPMATLKPMGSPAPPPPPPSTPAPAPLKEPLKEVEKPKILPGALSQPWKKEKVSDQLAALGELKKSGPVELPSFGGVAKPAAPLSIDPPPVGTPQAPVSKEEAANFAKIFGPPTGTPAPPPAKPSGPKPDLSVDDKANFAKIFGEPPVPPRPSGPVPTGTPAPPAVSKDDAANFDKIFGGGTTPPSSPPPAAIPAPPAVIPAPPPVRPAPPVGIPAPPAISKDDAANFDKIFGGGMPAAPPPPPPMPAPPPAAPPLPGGGLNTLGDLTKAIEDNK